MSVQLWMPHARRKRASQAVRSLIAYNQDYKCAACGDKLPVGWHLDHFTPLCDPSWAESYPNADAATNAANGVDNLQALCGSCHGRKSLLEQEPGLMTPPAPRPRARGIPWQAQRVRKRHQTDAIWALASSHDQLSPILTSADIWAELQGATTDRAFRQIHRKIERKGRRINYETFRQRVDHLLAS